MEQLTQVLLRDVRALAERVQAGLPQDLVRVSVADAGDHALLRDDVLDHAAALHHHGHEAVFVQVGAHDVRAHLRPTRDVLGELLLSNEEGAPHQAVVEVAQVHAVVEVQDPGRLRAAPVLGLNVLEAACQHRVDDEKVAALEWEQEELGVAVDGLEGLSLHPLQELLAPGAHDPGDRGLGLDDRQAGQALVEIRSVGFKVRYLWHPWRASGRAASLSKAGIGTEDAEDGAFLFDRRQGLGERGVEPVAVHVDEEDVRSQLLLAGPRFDL